MTTVRAIDFDDKEITIENVEEISQDLGEISQDYVICGYSQFFNYLFQCPDCRNTPDKTCGKYFVYRKTRTNPDSITVDGKPVKEIIEIV